jgi:hypothetical protein
MLLSVNKHVLGLKGVGWAEGDCNDGTSRAHDAFFNYGRYAQLHKVLRQ